MNSYRRWSSHNEIAVVAGNEGTIHNGNDKLTSRLHAGLRLLDDIRKTLGLEVERTRTHAHTT